MSALDNARRTAERLAAGDERELARMLDHLLICNGCGGDLAVVLEDSEQLCADCAHQLGQMTDHAINVRCAYCAKAAVPWEYDVRIPICVDHVQNAADVEEELELLTFKWRARGKKAEKR